MSSAVAEMRPSYERVQSFSRPLRARWSSESRSGRSPAPADDDDAARSAVLRLDRRAGDRAPGAAGVRGWLRLVGVSYGAMRSAARRSSDRAPCGLPRRTWVPGRRGDHDGAGRRHDAGPGVTMTTGLLT